MSGMKTQECKWSLLPAMALLGVAALVLAGCGGGGGGGGRTPEGPQGPEIPIMPADDHGDSRSDATALALGSSVAGRIETGGDEDFFEVEVTVSGTLTIYTTGNLDTVGELLAGDGSSLATDDDSGGQDNFRIEHDVGAGTYHVRVGSDDTATGSYIVLANFTASGDNDGPPPGHIDEPDTAATAKTIASGQQVTGYFEEDGDVDYLRLPLSEGLNEIDLDLNVPDGTEITVLDGNGNVLFTQVVQQGSAATAAGIGKQALSLQVYPLEGEVAPNLSTKVVTYCRRGGLCELVVKLAKKRVGKAVRWVLTAASGGKAVQTVIRIINLTPLKIELGLTVEVVNFDLKSFAECSFNAAVSSATIAECTKDIEFDFKHVIGSSIELGGVTLTGWRIESGIFVGRAPPCGAKAGEYKAVIGTRLKTEQAGEKINGPELVVPITLTESDDCGDDGEETPDEGDEEHYGGAFAASLESGRILLVSVSESTFSENYAAAFEACEDDLLCVVFPMSEGDCVAGAVGESVNDNLPQYFFTPLHESALEAEESALERCRSSQSVMNCRIYVPGICAVAP